MAKKTQGTDLYVIDPADCSLIPVGCPTSITGIDTPIDQIETTCLNATARTYEAGLASPGTASFGINTDPQDSSHVRLLELKMEGEVLKWAVGWSEDPGTPPTTSTDSDGECVFVLPDSRSWITFEGFINSFSFDFSQNSVVQSTVGIQVSGDVNMIPAAS